MKTSLRLAVVERDDALYQELQAYTLTRGDGTFIHQHVVDARAAQTATESTKPIAITFALMGLFLHAEHDWTGRDVQRGHMRLALVKGDWPVFTLPVNRGTLRPADVMQHAEGEARDAAVHAWAVNVWMAFASNRTALQVWLQTRGLNVNRPPR